VLKPAPTRRAAAAQILHEKPIFDLSPYLSHPNNATESISCLVLDFDVFLEMANQIFT
jgi:hypothetical protein